MVDHLSVSIVGVPRASFQEVNWLSYDLNLDLLGGLEHEWIMTFHSVGNVIIPTDFHIFQRGWNHQPVTLWFVSKRSFDLCKGFWTTRDVLFGPALVGRLALHNARIRWQVSTPFYFSGFLLESEFVWECGIPMAISWGRLSMDRMRYTILKATFYFDLFWMKLWTPVLMSTKQFFQEERLDLTWLHHSVKMNACYMLIRRSCATMKSYGDGGAYKSIERMDTDPSHFGGSDYKGVDP